MLLDCAGRSIRERTNVLISDDYEESPEDASDQSEVQYPFAKLCDFGLCSIIDSSRGEAYMERKVGT